MQRPDGRTKGAMRPVKITTDYTMYAEGSVLVEMGNTKVICTASVEEKVPPFLEGKGLGWVTAEYAMLPRATNTRKKRDIKSLKLDGRSSEIQRLIGRALRAVVDREALGERQITIDCDVIQADGGTRCASITGGFVALWLACKKLLAECKEPRVILGFNTAAEVFWQREFEVLGVPLTVTTADGTQGVKGFVTDAMVPLEGKYDYVYACGPEPMLRAVHAVCERQDIHGQFSFEERMACGFGVCMGCSCKTRYGSKRICKDGPVLRREEILW